MIEKKKSLQRCIRAVYEASPPTYLLDLSYCFMDWNRAFAEILAGPMKLKKGEHALELIKWLDNKEAVIERSTKVFSVGENLPYVDQEVLVWTSKRFGRITFRKFATQVLDDRNEHLAWVVHLAIEECEKKDDLWKTLARAILSGNRSG